MKDCPICKTSLEGAKRSCANCGWSQRKDKINGQESSSWPDSCEYESAGLRCRFPSVFSSGTRGGGPYYCRFHSRTQGGLMDSLVCKQSQQYRYETVAQQDAAFDMEVAESLKAKGLDQKPGESKPEWIARMRKYCLDTVRNIGKLPTDPKAWAKKLIDRHEAGEILSTLQLKTACEALHLDCQEVSSRREPGWDG